MSEPTTEAATTAGRVSGKVALVTGAARGLGRSHAVTLAAEGADVVVVDLCAEFPNTAYRGATTEDLEETARLVRQLGRRAVPVQADVTTTEEVDAAAELAMTEFGRLDIVVANAGVITEFGSALDASEADFRRTLDVNLLGVWRTARATIPHMRAAGRGGSIVVTNSVSGLKGSVGAIAYISSKHGVVGLTKALAAEFGPASIRVNGVHPTQSNTTMISNEAYYQAVVPDMEGPTRDDYAERAMEGHLLPISWVEPVDISNAVLFLASDEARYVTGVSLPVDAGFMVK